MIAQATKEKIVRGIDRCAFAFFAVLIFLIPISNAGIESCFGFIYLCFILRCIFRRPTFKAIKTFFKNRINLALLVFYICIGLSMLMSGPLLKKSFHAWFFKWGEGFLLFYFAQVFLTKKQIKLLMTVALFTCFIICLDGLYQRAFGVVFLRNLKLTKVNSAAPRASFSHYNDFATYLIVMFFLLFGFLGYQKKWVLQIPLIFLIILVLTNLSLTYSRGAWLSLIITGLLLAIFFGNKRIKIISLLVISIFILLITNLPFAKQRFFLTFQSGGDANRFNMWKIAFLMFKDSPLLGQGIGQFMDHVNDPKYFERMGGVMFQQGQYAHNCFLQILAETGALGFLSFLLFLGALLLRSYTKLKENTDFLFTGIFLAILAFLMHSFFDTQLYSLKLSILFWVLASFLAVYAVSDIKQDD